MQGILDMKNRLDGKPNNTLQVDGYFTFQVAKPAIENQLELA